MYVYVYVCMCMDVQFFWVHLAVDMALSHNASDNWWDGSGLKTWGLQIISVIPNYMNPSEGNHFPLLNMASTMWHVFLAFWGFVSHSWRCPHDSQLQIMCGCQRWKMEKRISWNYVSMQSAVTLNPLVTICSTIIVRRRNHMSIGTLLALFVTALVWPKPVWEKSSSSHLAEYRGIPPPRNSKIDVHEREAISLPLLLRASARKPCATSASCCSQSSTWKPNAHSEAWRSWSKQGLCGWYACLGFHLLFFFLFSFLDVVTIFWGTLSNLCSLTPKFLHCPSVPFKTFLSYMFLHGISSFSYIRYISPMGRLSSPMFHDELKTKPDTEVKTDSFDSSSEGNFSRIPTLFNTKYFHEPPGDRTRVTETFHC